MVWKWRFLLVYKKTNKLANEAANDSTRVSGQDSKIPPALVTNQIAGFGRFHPLASLEKNKWIHLFEFSNEALFFCVPVKTSAQNWLGICKGSCLFTSQRVDRRALVFIVPIPSNRLHQMIVDSKPIPFVPPSTYVAFVTV